MTVGLGVFVLVLGGGVATGLAFKTRAPGATADPVVVQSASGTAGTFIDGRTTAPLTASDAAGTFDATTRTELIPVKRATRIALALVPGGALQRTPELVNYQGQMAYNENGFVVRPFNPLKQKAGSRMRKLSNPEQRVRGFLLLDNRLSNAIMRSIPIMEVLCQTLLSNRKR